jgi:alcohol dehydrogenase (cytochrome c)
MYFPLQNSCMDMTTQIDRPSLSSLYGFSSRNQIAPKSDGKLGAVHAIAVETGKTAWKYEQRAATTSLVATGGRLLFGGDANGRFRALDQETGKVLWEVNLGSAVTGYPITYAVGGRQYVAVSTGGSLATGGLNGLTPEIRPGASNTLFVFALPVM